MADEFKDKVDEIVEKAKEIASIGAKKAGELAQLAAEKTGDVIDAAKKKLEIEKIEYAMNKKYRELGKAYYTKINGDESVCLDEYIDSLKTLSEALEILNTEEDEEEACCDDEECKCCCGCVEEKEEDAE